MFGCLHQNSRFSILDLRLLSWEYKSNSCKVCQTFNIVQSLVSPHALLNVVGLMVSNIPSTSICCFCSLLLFFRYVRSSCFSFNYPLSGEFREKGIDVEPPSIATPRVLHMASHCWSSATKKSRRDGFYKMPKIISSMSEIGTHC